MNNFVIDSDIQAGGARNETKETQNNDFVSNYWRLTPGEDGQSHTERNIADPVKIELYSVVFVVENRVHDAFLRRWTLWLYQELKWP